MGETAFIHSLEMGGAKPAGIGTHAHAYAHTDFTLHHIHEPERAPQVHHGGLRWIRGVGSATT